MREREVGRTGSHDLGALGVLSWFVLSPTSSQLKSGLTMDAADDREVTLQRASGDLVAEFSVKLPSLLWKTQIQNSEEIRVARRRAPAAKAERLVGLV